MTTIITLKYTVNVRQTALMNIKPNVKWKQTGKQSQVIVFLIIARL